MSVEGDPTSGTFYIDDLNATYPAGDESKSQGDDHLRLIKKALLNTFPSVTAPVTASHTELNYVDVTTLGTQQASKAVTADANNTVTVPSGGEINFASGSALQIGGVAVTADAAELNKLDGVTVTTEEFNKLAGVTATTAELNYVDVTTLGTMEASKAIVPDANNDVIVPSTGKFTLQSGANITLNSGATITAGSTTLDTTELGYLNGVTSNIQDQLNNTGGISQDSLTTLSSGTSATKLASDTPKRITVLLNAVSTNSTSPLQIQIYNSTFPTTTYLGWYNLLTNSTAVSVANITSGIPVFPTGAAGNLISGKITFTQLESGSYIYLCEGSFFEEGSTTKICHVVGKITASNPVDYVKLTTINGTDTFDSGQWNVIWEY